jgi:hypothetical protein
LGYYFEISFTVFYKGFDERELFWLGAANKGDLFTVKSLVFNPARG